MSEYIIENGGPVVPGKVKFGLLSNTPSVVSYTKRIHIDKLLFQDAPILALMIIHFLGDIASEGTVTLEMVAESSYIFVIALSILSAKISLLYDRPAKEVDYRTIALLIEDRLNKEVEEPLSDADKKQKDTA